MILMIVSALEFRENKQIINKKKAFKNSKIRIIKAWLCVLFSVVRACLTWKAQLIIFLILFKQRKTKGQ